MNKKSYKIIILCLQMNMFNICHSMDYDESYGNSLINKNVIINYTELDNIGKVKCSDNRAETGHSVIMNSLNNNNISKRSNDSSLEENTNNNLESNTKNEIYENNNCNCLKNWFNTIKSYVFCKNSIEKNHNSMSKNMCRKATHTTNLIEVNEINIKNHKTSVNLKSNTPSKIGIIKNSRKTSAEISNWPIFEISANCHIVNRQNKTVFVNNKEVKISKIKDDYNNLSKKHGSSFELDKLAYNAKYKAVQNKTFCNIF